MRSAAPPTSSTGSSSRGADEDGHPRGRRRAGAGPCPARPPPARATTPACSAGWSRWSRPAGGPPGAIATLYRDGKTTVLRAGYGDRANRRRPRSTDHMRIASVAKAFSGAVALRLVRDGRLGLDDTVARHRPDLPAAWGAVTVRQLLNHTSGVPDYTKSDGFVKQFRTAPKAYVSPAKIISWVARDKLVFRPGARYEYSNTDNIVVGLIAETVTGQGYGTLLRDFVFGPLGLGRDSVPARDAAAAALHPRLRDRARQEARGRLHRAQPLRRLGLGRHRVHAPEPVHVHARVRVRAPVRHRGAARAAPLRGRRPVQPARARAPTRPAWPCSATARRCGTVYGHTGNFPGYVQWAAASSDGQRVVTTSLNIPAPEGALLRRLRAVQEDAVCALLRD